MKGKAPVDSECKAKAGKVQYTGIFLDWQLKCSLMMLIPRLGDKTTASVSFSKTSFGHSSQCGVSV